MSIIGNNNMYVYIMITNSTAKGASIEPIRDVNDPMPIPCARTLVA